MSEKKCCQMIFSAKLFKSHPSCFYAHGVLMDFSSMNMRSASKPASRSLSDLADDRWNSQADPFGFP